MAVFAAIAMSGPVLVDASQLGAEIPSNCVAHTSFSGGADLVDDYRCAGLAIEFHTAGVAFSPGPIWAGQWLFVDEAGQFRVGSCTFNRGIHPTIDALSTIVVQQFPNDPTGAKRAYLTWRYGDTTDNLTAAAMWAVFHYYAHDGAGTNRAVSGTAPLVPSLMMLARASGRDDLQALALQLDAEATRFAGEWTLTATIDVAGHIETTLAVSGRPLAGGMVTLLMSGQDDPTTLETDADGIARSTMPVAPGAMTVVASTPAPGPALVYRGKPAGPDPHGAQNLVTGGAPQVLSATATVEVPIPTTTSTTTTLPATSTSTSTTTTTTTTTTTLPATTTSTSTTMVSATTTPTSTSTTTTTVAPTTTSSTTTTLPPTTVEVVISAAPPTTDTPPIAPFAEAIPPITVPALPKTGDGSDLISYLGTSLLVAGIGIVGVASRRSPVRRPPRRAIYTR